MAAEPRRRRHHLDSGRRNRRAGVASTTDEYLPLDWPTKHRRFKDGTAEILPRNAAVALAPSTKQVPGTRPRPANNRGKPAHPDAPPASRTTSSPLRKPAQRIRTLPPLIIAPPRPNRHRRVGNPAPAAGLNPAPGPAPDADSPPAQPAFVGKLGPCAKYARPRIDCQEAEHYHRTQRKGKYHGP